jgi:MFS family permease
VTKVAPPALRGTALGVYNTLQSLGLFAGGFLGGALVKWGGHPAVFGAAAVVMLAWLAVAWGMKAQPAKQS